MCIMSSLSVMRFLPGYRTVDALLQRMFEADLDGDDFAESDDPNGNFSNPTFSPA